MLPWHICGHCPCGSCRWPRHLCWISSVFSRCVCQLLCIRFRDQVPAQHWSISVVCRVFHNCLIHFSTWWSAYPEWEKYTLISLMRWWFTTIAVVMARSLDVLGVDDFLSPLLVQHNANSCLLSYFPAPMNMCFWCVSQNSDFSGLQRFTQQYCIPSVAFKLAYHFYDSFTWVYWSHVLTMVSADGNATKIAKRNHKAEKYRDRCGSVRDWSISQKRCSFTLAGTRRRTCCEMISLITVPNFSVILSFVCRMSFLWCGVRTTQARTIQLWSVCFYMWQALRAHQSMNNDEFDDYILALTTETSEKMKMSWRRNSVTVYVKMISGKTISIKCDKKVESRYSIKSWMENIDPSGYHLPRSPKEKYWKTRKQ